MSWLLFLLFCCCDALCLFDYIFSHFFFFGFGFQSLLLVAHFRPKCPSVLPSLRWLLRAFAIVIDSTTFSVGFLVECVFSGFWNRRRRPLTTNVKSEDEDTHAPHRSRWRWWWAGIETFLESTRRKEGKSSIVIVVNLYSSNLDETKGCS